MTNNVNSFVVVGIRRTAASLHRTLDSAYGTVIRVRARRNLHFGNCPVLSRIGERPESRINGHAQILAGVGVLQRACSFGNKLQEKALLALAHFTHDPTVLHFSGLCGIRRILQSPGEPVVALVNANTVHVLADGYALLICFPDDAGAIGLPFDRMQSASRTDEPRRAAVVEVAFHRDPRSRSELLTFVDAEQVAASRSLAVHGDVGMKVVLAQAEPHAKITEGFCPFTALRHGSCGLPLGRGAHFN